MAGPRQGFGRGVSLETRFSAAAPPPPTDNLLLGALPGEDYRRLQPYLEPVAFPLGKVIFEPREPVNHVYFPTMGVISLLTVLEDGTSGEIAIVGNDGFIGVSSLLQGHEGLGPPYRGAVTIAGQCYRLQVDVLMKELERGGELWRRLLRYTQALMTQIAQTVVCNRHHRLEMQMCRWLLLRLDRLVDSELRATHDQIANQLGVRREGVTAAAGHLQECGLIRYSQGHIVVLDRAGLEQRVCECYGVVEREYARLLRVAVPAATTRRKASRDARIGRLSDIHWRVTST